MKARLIKDKDETLCILCHDGSIAKADKNNLNKMLSAFHFIDQLTGDPKKRWDKEYPDMGLYPGEEFALVTDGYQLVITNFKPFKDVFTIDVTNMNLVTASEYGEANGKSVEQIKVLCRNGRIPGATKIGRDWMIPADAPYPVDNRYAFKNRR